MTKIGSQIMLRTRGIIVFLCLVAVNLFCQTADGSEQRTFPLINDPRDAPVMAIRVNGIETTAMLDTGATIALIDDEYLSESQPLVLSNEATRVLGLGGLREYPVTTLSELTIGARSWKDLRVAVNTSDQFPVRHSIIPMSLFPSSIVDFEFSKSRVHIYNGRPKRMHSAVSSTIRYDNHHRLVFIPIRINKVEGLALIDTGAVSSFVNPAFARQARAVPDAYEQERMQGSDLARQTAHIHTFRDLRLGDFRISKTRIPVLGADLFHELGYGDTPMMVMGMDFLSHFRLQVDQRRQRVTFIHSATRKRPGPVRFRSGRLDEMLDR